MNAPLRVSGSPRFASRLRSIVFTLAALLVFSAATLVLAQTTVSSGTITTIAGNGSPGYSGDGGPATSATMTNINGLAIGRDGTLYLGDASNYCIRAVNPVTGIISTIGGNGNPGGDGEGNGGPATEAALSVYGLATDRSRNFLFFSDVENNWVRKIDLNTGILTAYAGDGVYGFDGDGGPAVAAHLVFPLQAATDGAGHFTFLDSFNFRFRRVNAVTGIIMTVAGNGNSGSYTGDGGPATSASLCTPTRVVADASGNLFIRDRLPSSGPCTVRRIDAVTGIINTIAGGGSNPPGTGVATSMSFPNIHDLAVNDAGELFISSNIRIYKLTLATGILTPFAGDGAIQYAGDGGPALLASFGDIHSLAAVPGGGLVIADSGAWRIRYVAPVSVNLSNDSGQTAFYLPWVSSLTGSITLANNPNVTVISMGSLTTVTGSVDISGNTGATAISMGSLESVTGSVTIGGNTSVGSVALGSLSDAGGDVTISANAPNAIIDLSSLTDYGDGSVPVTMSLNGGTVQVGSGFTLGANATLTGSATIDGSVTSNGTIEPGSVLGALTITGQLALTGTSSLVVQIGGTAPGEFDSVNVAGAVTLGGELSVTLLNPYPSLMTSGTSFTVLTAGSTISGAFSNVASGGTLTTTDGYARFTVRYAGESAVRLTDLVIVDSDSDAMPDWWEDLFGLNKNSAADASLDFDGDGRSNLEEWAALTHPVNDASYFASVLSTAGSNLLISFSSAVNRTYRLIQSADLTLGSFVPTPGQPVLSGTGAILTFTVPMPPEPRRFYQVQVSAP